MTTNGARRLIRLFFGGVLVSALVACSERDVILEGERFPVREDFADGPILLDDGDIAPVTADAGFTPPEVTRNNDWTHVAGGPTHISNNPAVSASPELIWSQGIGQGNSRKHRITSQPVIGGGRVYVMDSRSRVSAITTAGQELWSQSLVPAEERENDASGGGVAISGTRVFATTGFGEVLALDAATGAIAWRQSIDAPATASPTVVGDIVYAVGRDNRAWAIDATNGRVKWQLPGTPGIAGVVGGAAPAVNEQVAIFPFGSGELVAALRQGGVRLWGSAISGKRAGRAYANIGDITADPVIVGDMIYTGNQSGRAVALSLNSGNRVWTARHGAYGPVTVAGNSVFLVSDQSELVRLDAASGQEIWAKELPYFKREKARRSKAIFAHYGPVMAGNLLWIASDDGTLKSYDPATGNPSGSVKIPGGAASSVSVANGTMYVLSSRGQLHAFR